MEEKQKIKAAFEHAMLANTNEETVKATHPDALLLGSSEEGDFGYCAVKDNQIIVAFRGSDDKSDWTSNLKERVNSYGYHTGFWDATHKYIEQIKDFIFNHVEVTEVLFCGHSRGGALSLLSNYLVDLHYTSRAIVFGCPKVCTKDSMLYKDFKDNCIHVTSIVNGMDIVPRAPFEFPWNKDYSRIGKEIVIGKRLSFRDKAKMMWAAIKKDGDWKWFFDHKPSSYSKSLTEW